MSDTPNPAELPPPDTHASRDQLGLPTAYSSALVKKIVAQAIAADRAQLAQANESVAQYQQNVYELAEELRSVRAQLAQQGQEPIYQLKSLLHQQGWHDTDWNTYEWHKANNQAVRIVYAAPASAQPAQQVSDAQAAHNQCDGCQQGAAINVYGNHVNSSGVPFMTCQASRYAVPQPADLSLSRDAFISDLTYGVYKAEIASLAAPQPAARAAVPDGPHFANDGREPDWAAYAAAEEFPELPEPAHELQSAAKTDTFTAEQMFEYGRKCSVYRQLKQVGDHLAAMSAWARENGLNVPPQWDATVTDYGSLVDKSSEWRKAMRDLVRVLRGVECGDDGQWKFIANVCEIAEELLAASPATLTAPAQPAEELVRFCPHCASIGEIGAEYRDCCPDGSAARQIPRKLAEVCRDTFKLAISNVAAPAAQQAGPNIDLSKLPLHFKEGVENGGYYLATDVIRALALAAPATAGMVGQDAKEGDLMTVRCPACVALPGLGCDECHGQGEIIVSRTAMAAQQAQASAKDEGCDPLYDKAVAVVRAYNRASLSLVQRTLVLGYNRTARLFEAMEKDGVISPHDEKGHRTVLVAKESSSMGQDSAKGDAA